MRKFEKEDAVGKWLSIILSLGIEIDGHSKHEKCPLCSREGSHGFRFDDKDGTGSWICTCGAGDGWSFVMKYFDEDFVSALDRVRKSEDSAGGFKAVKPKGKKLATADYLKGLFVGANKQKKGDVVDYYLEKRGIKIRPDDNLWHSPKHWHSDLKENLNAMMSVWIMPDGKAVQLERVYLTPDGTKIEKVKIPKKMTSALIKETNGGCVRLFNLGDSEILGISEGIETTLAAAQDFGIPFWSTWTAGRLASWVPPKSVIDQVKHIVIVGDNDDSFTGQAAAYALAKRLRITYKKEVSVFFPDKTLCDWLDVLNGECGCRLRG